MKDWNQMRRGVTERGRAGRNKDRHEDGDAARTRHLIPITGLVWELGSH